MAGAENRFSREKENAQGCGPVLIIKYLIERVGLRQIELHGRWEAFSRKKGATLMGMETEKEERNVRELMGKSEA